MMLVMVLIAMFRCAVYTVNVYVIPCFVFGGLVAVLCWLNSLTEEEVELDYLDMAW